MPRVRTVPILLAALTLAAAGCGGGQSGASGTTTGNGTEPTTTGGPTSGDATRGSIIWVTEGCNNCHTLGGNPATSQEGPNFDTKRPERATIVEVVTNGKGTMPGFGDSLSPQDVEDVAAYIHVTAGT
jgi:cytochrome c551